LGSFDNFDMSSFAEASKQLKDSTAFPAIEFPGSYDYEDDEFSSLPAAKRRCRGLVRSNNASFDLSSLFERRGSYGSLC
jgi:hypothetical protein